MQIARGADINLPHVGYEPVETRALLNLLESMLAEAESAFGPSAHPIRSVWIVRSVPRKHPARLSRAEILDWQAWASRMMKTAIYARLAAAHGEDIASLARGESISAAGELAIVEALNEIICDPDWLRSHCRDEVELLPRKKPFWKWRDHERDNREALNRLFAPFLAPIAKPTREGRGMACCELFDAAAGRYIIYLRAAEDDPEFLLEFAHEVAHLIDPGFYDWCVEGVNMLFARRMAEKYGFSWEPWRKRFEYGDDRDAYAVALQMMAEVERAVGAEGIRIMLRHQRTWNNGTMKAVDLDAWLAALPPSAAGEARNAFARHGSRLLKTKRAKDNFFALPMGMRK